MSPHVSLRKPVQTYIIPILFQVDQLAAGLVSRGLTKGDRLAIWLPNIREWILVQFAAAQIGLILVRVIQISRDLKIRRRQRQRKRQNNNSARAAHFFVYFLAFVARLRLETA